ncbi:MAG TPA: ribonuclease P protein component [Acidimicrobiia bacterium]|nr:ribonuclease P protein component [Acidimicrobiia bacterium]
MRGGPRAESASPPKPVSLDSPASFRHVLATGRRRRVGDLVVVLAAGQPGIARFGLVVGRRIGSAVERNRAKRRLREAIRQVGMPVGYDVVIIAGASTPTVPFLRLSGWLSEGINEARAADQASKEGHS